MQIEIDEFLRFSDYFLDGLIADWTVLNRIRDSKAEVNSVITQIKSGLNQQEKMDKAVDCERRNCGNELDELVKNSTFEENGELR